MTDRRYLSSLLSLVGSLAAGCGMSTTPGATDGGSMHDGTVAIDTGPGDVGPGDAGDLVECSGHDATSFPSFDRSCTTDADCTIGAHQTDCCGSIDAMGIARSEASRFEDDEATCESQYPACGCDSGSVTTDDGSTPPPGTFTSAVVVRCTSGTCTTSARPSTPCGASTCAPSQVCLTQCSGTDAGVPPPQYCADVPPACAASTDCSCFGSIDPCRVGGCVRVDHGAPVCMCG